jgi:hypothetical protein
MPTAIALTPYEAALAAVPDAKKSVVPAVKPSPKRKVGKGKVPASSEVKVHGDGVKSKAKSKAAVGKAVAAMTGKKATGKAAAKKSAGVKRLTDGWFAADKTEVKIKDKVKANGITFEVAGRFTNCLKDGTKVPMLYGKVDGKGIRVVASTVTRVK